VYVIPFAILAHLDNGRLEEVCVFIKNCFKLGEYES